MKRKITPSKGGRFVGKSTSVTPAIDEKIKVLYDALGRSLGDIVQRAVEREYAEAFNDDYDPGEKITVRVEVESLRGWASKGEVDLVIKQGGNDDS